MGGDVRTQTRDDLDLRGAFEDAPAGMALHTLGAEPAVFRVNRAAAEIARRPERELIHGDALTGLLGAPGEQRLERGDGETVWVDVERAVVRDAEGRPLHGICQFRDVTAARAAREALRESEARLRTILETTHEGVSTLDAEDRVTFANARFAELLGYTVEEMIGRPVTDFYDAEGRELLRARLAGRRRGVADQYEARLVGRDGRELWAIVSASPLTDAGGRYAGGLAIVTDITDRILHERAVRASEERYRNIVETTIEGVWMIDRDHRTTYVNRRMAELLGYRVEEMLGKPASHFAAAEADGGLQHEPAGGGSTRAREVRYRRKDGTEMWGLLSGSPLTDGAGAYGGALAMVADITDRKHSEEAVARLAAIVESSPDAILSTDPGLVITSWNPAATRLYGYQEEEAVGRSVWMLAVPEQRAELEHVARAALAGGSVEPFVAQAVTRDGRTIDVAPSVSAIRSPSGAIAGVLAIVRSG